MNLYLLQYDRRRRELLGIKEFPPGEYEEANRCLLEAELANPDLEVVLLEAASVKDLEHTHGRYFKDLASRVLKAS